MVAVAYQRFWVQDMIIKWVEFHYQLPPTSADDKVRDQALKSWESQRPKRNRPWRCEFRWPIDGGRWNPRHTGIWCAWLTWPAVGDVWEQSRTLKVPCISFSTQSHSKPRAKTGPIKTPWEMPKRREKQGWENEDISTWLTSKVARQTRSLEERPLWLPFGE